MPSADEYRVKAADLNALAQDEPNQLTRANFLNLALAYLRLAEQADKNAATDIVYETPPSQPMEQHPQQQQQTQPDKKSRLPTGTRAKLALWVGTFRK